MDADSPVAFSAPLSDALRQAIEAASGDRNAGIAAGTALILEEIPDYRLSIDPLVAQNLRHSCADNAELWYDALLRSRPLSGARLENVVGYARHRVHQGISLTALLYAYRLFARAIWAQLVEAVAGQPSLQAELLTQVSPYLLQHFDTVTAAVARTYLEEQSRHGQWRDRLREELWLIILSRPDDAQGFRRHAESLGLSPLTPHCAVVVELRDSSSPRELPIDSLALSLARRLHVAPDLLMRAVYREKLVLWVPVPQGLSTVDADAVLADAATALLSPATVTGSVGVGLPGLGAHGWHASMEQGVRALAAADPTQAGPQVHRYSQILLEDGALANENVAGFMRGMIDALAIDPTLSETLRAYLQNRLQRKSTAAALNVHPNTLDHRLGRIEALLGGSFADVDWLARVSIALRISRPRGDRPAAGR